MAVACGEAEVCWVGGGINEHGERGERVADTSGGRGEGGDARDNERGEVCAEGDGGERDGEREDGLPDSVDGLENVWESAIR